MSMRRATSSALARRSLIAPARSLSYQPPHRDVKFLFYDVLDMEGRWKEIAKKHKVDDLVESTDKDTVLSILEAAGDFGVDQLLPMYQESDTKGAKYDGKTQNVLVSPGFQTAYDAFCEAGWNTLSVPAEYGGQGLPASINLAKTEFMATSNWSWNMFPGLTLGAMNTLQFHASPEQKAKYLTKLTTGEWSGTMCLTESHAGTDLAQNKTKAEPVDAASGVYKITGTKIFISCGEHDMSDNIIHIVLAKVPNGPPGVKGISLFIVPKYTDEELKKPKAERKKNVVCAGIEKKMGIHGSPTCIMSFEGSTGYLLGELHDGLRQMFTFMNTARLGVAVQGVSHSELAYQNAYKYAVERKGMSPPSGRVEPDLPADPMIHLPEIKRLLLTARVVADGGRHIAFKCARALDELSYTHDHEIHKKLEDEVGWYTPVAKGFVTELSMEACYNAMQVLGGHGYIEDWGFEQIYRDARIATMYEGTTAIQGMDLIGRKMAMNKFKTFMSYVKHLVVFAAGHARSEGLFSSGSRHAKALLSATLSYSSAMSVLIRVLSKSKADRDALTSNAIDNLFAMGYIMFAEVFLEQRAVIKKLTAKGGLSEDDKKFYAGKMQTIDFFFDRMFPRVHGHIKVLRNSDESLRVKDHTIMPIR